MLWWKVSPWPYLRAVEMRTNPAFAKLLLCHAKSLRCAMRTTLRCAHLQRFAASSVQYRALSTQTKTRKHMTVSERDAQLKKQYMDLNVYVDIVNMHAWMEKERACSCIFSSQRGDKMPPAARTKGCFFHKTVCQTHALY